MTLPARLASTLRYYLPLGFTSFGGPGVHVIILREKFVHRLKWVDERTFLDLFALGNALPGPGSTQLAFSIAVVKHGVLPGLVAFLCWSLPGALGMAGLAAGISNIPAVLPPIVLALLSGLNAAAVGLIALAAYQLGTAAATDKVTLALVWLSASFGICYHAPWMYPSLIVAGGAVTLVWDFRRQWIYRPAKRAFGRERARDEPAEAEGMELPTLPPRLATPVTARPSPAPLPDTSHFPSPPPSPIVQPAAIEEDSLKSDLTSGRPASTTTHRRSTTHTDPEVPAVVEAQRHEDLLQVISPRSAFALIGGFVLLLVIPLAVRGGLANSGKTVPRELDVSGHILGGCKAER